MKLSSLRPSPALIVALAALVMAMSGAAIALPGKGEVTSNDIAEDAVKSKHIKKNAVRSQEVQGKSLKGNDLKDGAIDTKQLKDDAVDSSKVGDEALDDSDIGDYELVGDSLVRVTATDAANEAAARDAAPETTLFQRGQLTVYAKCFRSVATDTVFAEVYARTTADGAIMEGDDDLPGGSTAAEFLNTATAEVDRQLDTETATANDANYDETEYLVATPDGTALTGQLGLAAKNGALAGGNGLYGDGNVCLFQGSLLG